MFLSFLNFHNLSKNDEKLRINILPEASSSKCSEEMVILGSIRKEKKITTISSNSWNQSRERHLFLMEKILLTQSNTSNMQISPSNTLHN